MLEKELRLLFALLIIDMKKLSLILITALMFIGCKKSDDITSSDKVIVKYEIITTSNVTNIPTNPTIVSYINATGQVEQLGNFTSGKSWTKTVTITATQRPLPLVLWADIVPLTSSGTVTGNIYVNNKIVATATNPTVASLAHLGFVSIGYELK